MKKEKIIIYSLLPRLWGNNCTNPTINGTLDLNGTGKLADLDDKALAYIKSLGATHLWCIGLLEHATCTEWKGIPADSPDIVKGVAGSPYAVRDYYDIAPAIATNVSERSGEFDALLERVHRAGIKLIMDFIPNHVARSYKSDVKPSGAVDLGCEDDSSKHFDAKNNFYYFPNEGLVLPDNRQEWTEYPARATGNDSFSPRPSSHDWYETIKLNYGVDYLGGGGQYFEPIPDTWYKMLDILLYWSGRGVDGFRCDMAEMVPEAFWSWAIPQVKGRHSDRSLLFLAEIYQPHRYSAYLEAGFDYLYDKVGVYDTLRSIIQGDTSAKHFDGARDAVGIHQQAMCYFLEDHDEQRIASDFFARNASIGVPALGVSLLSGANPYLLYFGQEIGERGMDCEGFSGLDGRTTIFDYWALPSIQRLRRDYGGSALREQEQTLLADYRKVLRFASESSLVVEGQYYGLNYLQRAQPYNDDKCLSYLRYTPGEAWLLVVANFSADLQEAPIHFPHFLLDQIGLLPNSPLSVMEIMEERQFVTTIIPEALWSVSLPPFGLRIYQLAPL